MRDHLIASEEVVVGVTFAALAARRFLTLDSTADAVRLRRLLYLDPIAVPYGGKVDVRALMQEGGNCTVGFRRGGESRWQDVATCLVEAAETPAAMRRGATGLSAIPADTLYQANPDVVWGPSFKRVAAAFASQNHACVDIEIPPGDVSPVADGALDPRVLNGVLFAAFAMLTSRGQVCAMLPLSVGNIVIDRRAASGRFSVEARLSRLSPELLTVDANIFDAEGRCVGTWRDFSLKRMARERQLSAGRASAPKPLHAVPENGAGAVRTFLGTAIARVLGRPVEDGSRNLLDLGMDSRGLVELAGEIGRDLSVELMPTLFFDYPSLDELVTHFSAQYADAVQRHLRHGDAAQLLPPQAPQIVRAPDPQPASLPGDAPIAIIGMAGRLGGSPDLESFWRNLVGERPFITEVPAERWNMADWFDADRAAENKSYCKWGSFIDGIAEFDPLFFNISPQQATWLDPQVRHLIEAVYHAAEDAGCIGAVRGSRTGVYAGVCFQEYWDEIIRNGMALTGHEHPSSYRSSIAAHISYALDLRGPSLPIDSACASSLSALHLACQAIRSGECDMAFACGTNLLISPLQFVYFSRIQAMSPTGRCHTFDSRADGFVPGEGAIALLLKPLDRAERDGDHIHAVIRGSAINHTGRAPNPTAPRPELQTEVLRTAWARAGISPRDLSYVECHGTGTKLGDPIEVNALRKAFGGDAGPEGHCVIGSVKAHIGHLEGAAGLAGIVNIVKSMQSATLPRMPEFRELNPMIRLEGSPFRILRETEAWQPSSGRRIAGVSGFGMTGNGAHVVIEAYEPPVRPTLGSHGPQLIVLSAKDSDRLRDGVAKLRSWLDGAGSDAWLPDIAHTLQVGREAFDHRWSCIAQTLADLRLSLDTYLAGGSAEGMRVSRVSRQLQAPERPPIPATTKLARLADAWHAGATVDWQGLARLQEPTPRRITVPGYAFARETYWFTPPQRLSATPGSEIMSDPVKEPMLEIDSLPIAPVWQEKPLAAGVPLRPGRSLIIAPRAAMALAQAIAARCTEPTILAAEDCATAASLSAALPRLDTVDALFFLAGAGAPDGMAAPAQLATAQTLNELLALRLFKALGAARGPHQPTDVFVLLPDCFSGKAARHNPAGAGVCGLAYSLAQSEARFRVRNIDLALPGLALSTSATPADIVSAILREPPAPRGDLVRHDGAVRYRRSFAPASLPKQVPPAFRRGGVYVLVGGAGAVGKVITRWLLSSWQARVVWIGRSPAAAVAQSLQSFADIGGVLDYVQADATDTDALARAMDGIRSRHGAINGAIYAPVVFAFANGIMETDEASFLSILDVKTRGSIAFAQALRNDKLDFLCFFSSSQAFAFSGAARLSAYAAGICFADSFATALTADVSYPVGIINWGFWHAFTQTKLWHEYQAAYPQAAAARHIGFLQDDEGIACFARFVASLPGRGASQIACLRQSEAVAELIKLSSEDVVMEVVEQKNEPVTPYALRVKLAELLGEVLRLPPERIDAGVPFAEYGIDSIATAAYVSRINAKLGCALSATALYDYPTLDALSAHIAPLLVTREPQRHPVVAGVGPGQGESEQANALMDHPDAIAVIGLSLEIPGAHTPDESWTLLREGRSVADRIPLSRLDGAEVTQLRAGILTRRDLFDPLFFHISPREAEEMSPYQRIALQEAWRCIEDGGYNPKALAESQTGVFFGAEPASFARASLTGGSDALIAARISYFLNLQGPALVVNTGCSSSAVAVHLACESLRRGETRMALAGGVFADVGPEVLRLLAGIGMLSPTGVCRPFDAEADGTMLAEGAAMVLLKPLRDALADGDPVRGIILATAMNQDGASNGITAPNGRSQEALLRKVYGASGIDSASISYVEAHGTGTILGDPIEVNALSRVFATSPSGRVAEHCRLGSVKATVGHTSAAAGAIGLVKLLLALEHRSIPGVPGFRRLNPKILDAGWKISAETVPWDAPAGKPRRAALNSFGHSGTNVHMVVEEVGLDLLPDARAQGDQSSHLVPLSARGADQLRKQASAMLRHLSETAAERLSLAAIAWTLQSGRNAGKERVIFHVKDIDALKRELASFLDGTPSVLRWQGSVEDPGQIEPARGDDLPSLAAHWVSGGSVVWERLHARLPRRLNLPPSAFAEISYPVRSAEAASIRSPSVPQIEPVAAVTPVVEDLLRLPVWRCQTLPPRATTLMPGAVAVFCTPAARPLAEALREREAALGSSVAILDLASGEPLPLLRRAYVLPWAAAGEEGLADGRLEALALTRIVELRRLVPRDAEVDLFVVTRHATSSGARTHGDARQLQVAGAGAAGLAYALAQSDHRFMVRNIDVAAAGVVQLADAIMAEPPDHRGNRIRLEDGQRLSLSFPSLAVADSEQGPAFRKGGTYVIAGGAGTVGGVITRFLMREHEARVIWIGRSPADSPKIQAKLASFHAQGLAPDYVQADVTDADAISAAIARIRAEGPISGAMFSSLVFAFEDTLDRVEESGFRQILNVKLSGGLNFFRALQADALDFLCYFSSAQAFAFSGATQFVSYAAAMTAADTLCQRLALESSFPLGILNWGFWKSSAENERLGANIALMTDEEGFHAFSRMVGLLRAGQAGQALALRPSGIVRAMMAGAEDEVGVAPTSPLIPAVMRGLQAMPAAEFAAVVAGRQPPRLQEFMPRLLLARLQSMGVMEAGRWQARSELQAAAAILPKYSRWLDEAIAILAQNGHVETRGDALLARSSSDPGLMTEWQHYRDQMCAHPQWRSNLLLLDACLTALPDILSGRTKATDILFPGGSLDRVSGVYSGIPLFDGLNDKVGEAVAFALDALRSKAPGYRARIVEIGAGTGGTTRRVLPRLGQREDIAEYLFTDLSRSFLIRAEDEFAAYPWFRTSLWNIEAGADEAGLAPGCYDIAIATNVLHATRSIAATLRNAKSALKAGGLLLINEITHNDAYGTLTFGLLDGWWLYDDPHLRVPGSPLLSPATWRQVLAEAGFSPVSFIAGDADEGGYHVIMAVSDGLALPLPASSAAPDLPDAAPAPSTVAQPVTTPAPTNAVANVAGLQRARSAIRNALCAATKLSLADVSDGTALSDYGVDSILGIRFIGHVNEALGLSLNPAVVFEHSTVDRLSKHVERLLPPEPIAPVPAEPWKESTVAQAPIQAVSSPAIPSEPQSPAVAPRKLGRDPIAVIGMSGQFPDAHDVETLWRNLAAGHDAVHRLPDDYLAGRTPDMRIFTDGGRLEERDCFDPLFFSITPREAESMSPHQRLIMQEGWKALEDAAIDPRSLDGKQVGVFIGAEPSGYMHETFSGQSDAIVASRLSYALNLRGPALAVNTGCSSSGMAIHLACESLRHRQTDLALAGGVCANLDTPELLNLLGIGMLSPSGRCKSFSAEADGTVMSEAAAVIVLKRLDDAMRDGDPIHGVIIASGANQDGASNGITAPNGEAQEDLIRETYSRFEVDPNEITYVETHGTGTALGDVVEANALTRAFAHFTVRRQFCAVTSAKSAIGHTSAAAGVTGLIAIAMAMRHGLIPGIQHYARSNPHIETAETALSFSAKNRPWPKDSRQQRTAALNCFGHSGTNVHIVMRDAPTPASASEARPASAPVLVPLSARNAAQLRDAARRLAAALASGAADGADTTGLEAVITQEVAALMGVSPAEIAPDESLSDIGVRVDQLPGLRQRIDSVTGFSFKAVPLSGNLSVAALARALAPEAAVSSPQPLDLPSVALTLQLGRAALAERVVFMVSSCEDLQAKLELFANGATEVEGCWIGKADSSSEVVSLFADDGGMDAAVQRWADSGRLDKLASIWVRGVALNWRVLHGHPVYRAARRLHLPTYPFARERYRKPRQAAPRALSSSGLPSAMLHENRSDLRGTRYASQFSAGQELLAEHRVGDEAVLPAAAAIEMALAAAVAATGRELRGLVLRHLTWARAMPLSSAELTVETHVSEVAHASAEATASQALLIDIKTTDGKVWFSTQASWEAPGASEAVASLRPSATTPVMSGDEFYVAVASSGIKLGPRYRLVGAVRTDAANPSARIATVAVPPVISAEAGGYLFHPCLIDAALQTVMALEGPSQGPMLPFSLDRLVVRSGFQKDFEGGTLLSRCRPGAGAGTFDIVLAGPSGEPLISMTGIAMRKAFTAEPETSIAQGPRDLTGRVLLAPVWLKISSRDESGHVGDASEDLFFAGALDNPVIGPRETSKPAHSHNFPVGTQDSVEDLLLRLQATRLPTHVVWLAPGGSMPSPEDTTAVQAQRDALLPFFRFVKALIALGRDAAPMAWTVVTRGGAAAVPGEPVNPAHASLHGFIGSLAKEMPEWRFRLLDVGSSAHDVPDFADVMRGPDVVGAEPAALRGGDWFERRLAPLAHGITATSAAYGDGVIVVIGGAGGIGAAWSEAMIRSRSARIVWIGRRPEDDLIRAAIARATANGASSARAPVYIQADAADASQLKAAVARIRAAYGPIRGVVHSAIVLADQIVANMSEAQLLAALRPKVDASIAMAHAFAGEPLDFVLFFSSVQSFLKMPGQSNYAAGSCFADAFAAALRNAWGCPVKVMDWGYWGNIGIVSSPGYRQRMGAAGMASIEPEEAWQALDLLFSSTLDQLALMHATAPLDFPVLVKEIGLHIADGTVGGAGSVINSLAPDLPQTGPEYDYVMSGGDFRMAVMEPYLRDIVAAQLRELGLSSGEARADQVPLPYLRRWLAHTPALLDAVAVAPPSPTPSVAQAWAAWDTAKPVWLAEPSRRAQVILVEAALRELPAILSGTRAATAVMLPDASLEMVEQVYTRNLAAQYFNRVLANALVALVNRLRAIDPQRPIRILEIGAGTGATSAMLFRALAEHGLAAQIGEYRYTDISHAFLAHAQDKFLAIAPYLRTSRLDIDKPLAAQGVEEGAYDIVIAANSIHTTRDVRRAVRNAKSALRTGGVLLLNEISGATLYGHLTFGLLEGWWLFDEPTLRIPGCPGLSPAAWRQVLRQQGFSEPLFPAEDRHSLGLQIIMAESNGLNMSPRTAGNAPGVVATEAVAVPAPAPAPTQAPPRIDAADLVGYVQAMMTRLISDATRIPLQEIEATRPFESYGIDSIVVIELAKQLRKVLPDASTTLFFEHQTIAALAGHLARTHGADLQAYRMRSAQASAAPPAPAAAVPAAMQAPPVLRSEAPPEPVPSVAVPPHAVAIIGLAGRYPMSPTLEAFWDNLVAGRNCISETPESRWNWRDYYDPIAGKPGAMSTSWGGFIDGIDRFDPLFFGISPVEAEGMNPQERLFLQTAWACIEDAGYTPERLNLLGKVGVYAGVMNDTYHRGAKHWSVANRVSYHCNFQGPSLAVDTACSSSLTALHLALESLQCGSCRVALVGGVNLITNPQHTIGLSQLRVLSSDDRNKTFSSEADGFVDAEGVGTVLLRPLADALAAGDHIHGVIFGSAINAGGKVNGYTVPNPRAQAAVVAEALSRAGVEPRSISYVEAHGTGTVLGDPIEIGGLTAAFGENPSGGAFCAIGSVKSNIGHAESAAGMAGLTKILLQMKHRTLVPSLHSEPLNPEINFAQTPFRVQTSCTKWVPPALAGTTGGRETVPPLRAGLSSFGAGGANAHVVVEEAPPRAARSRHVGPCLVVLSAQTGEQLRLAAERLQECLAKDAPALADIAFTLQHGRVQLEQRLAMVVGDLAGLRAELQSYLSGAASPSVAVGMVKRSNIPAPESVTAALAAGDLAKLGQLWVQGAAIDWANLMPEGTAHRISLPTYPFAEERCWAPDLPLPAALPQKAARARALAEPQRQQFVFSGHEDMLRDHRVSGQGVLPGVAYLGLIWQLITDVCAARTVTLTDVVWIAPFQPEGNPLDLELTPTAEGQGRFAFTSRRGGATVLHCAGIAAWRSAAPEQPAARNLMGLMSACRGRRIMPDDLQAAFRRIGVDYGATHQALGPVDLGQDQAFAPLSLPQGRSPAPLDPGLMDSALQACLCLIDGVVDDMSLRDAPLPFRLRRLDIFLPQGPWGFVHVMKQETASTAEGLDLDLEVLGPSGEVALRLVGLSSRAPTRAPAQPPKTGEAAMDELLCDLVRHALPDDKFMLPFFRPWLAQTVAYLEPSPQSGLSEAQLWERWKAQRAGWLADPMLAPRVALMEAALPAMEEVLTGRRKATDVLFPGGSLALVEPVYRGNPTADAFNKVLAARVFDYVSAHAKAGGLRVLEIGAGTGGTTHHVLEQLKPLQHAIAEYCYTDRSHSFLQHGERQYGAGRPFFVTRLLDIERSAEEQEFVPGSYDLVIAANVLHATRDMRTTMRNVRRLMRPGALLAMNELSGNALYAHLSFGLLDAWWRYDDAELRIPGSPGLSPQSWERLLSQEGFIGVSFPSEELHPLGQQIILANVERMAVVRPVPVVAPPAPAVAPPAAVAPAPAAMQPTEDRLGAIEEAIRANVARSLKIAPHRIENDRSFSDYGVDSILAVNLVNDIAEAVNAPLTTTVIFDYNTVERLARHVLESYPESGAAAGPVAAAAPVPPAVASPPAAAASGPMPEAAPAPAFDNRMRAALGAFEEADPRRNETVLLLTERPDIADLGEKVAQLRGFDLIVAAAPSPGMRGWLAQQRGCRGLTLDGPEFGKRLLAFNQRRKVDHIICDLPGVTEDLSQILRDGGQWLDVG